MEIRSHFIKKLTLLAALTLIPSLGFATATFKYSGEHGETVYSQTPPQNAKAERLTLKKNRKKNSARPSSVEVLEKFTRDQDDKQHALQKAIEKEKLSAVKVRNCAAAKHNLTIYTGSPNRLVKDSSGNYNRLNEETRQAKIEEAHKNIKAFCK